MAYDWFKLNVAMCDHPKVALLARLMDRPMAGWHVIRLWCWVAKYAPSGTIPETMIGPAEKAAGWSGRPGKLVEAMVAAGLCDHSETSPGGLEVHDWASTQGAWIAKSEKDAERKREDRKKRRAPLSDPGARRGEERRGDKTRSEERRGEEACGTPAQQPLLEVPQATPSEPTKKAQAPAKPWHEGEGIGPDLHRAWLAARQRKISALGLPETPDDKHEVGFLAANWLALWKACGGRERDEMTADECDDVLDRVFDAMDAWLDSTWAAGLKPPFPLQAFASAKSGWRRAMADAKQAEGATQ